MNFNPVFRHLVNYLIVLVAVFIGVMDAVAQQRPRLKVVSPTADSTVIDEAVAYFRGMADPSGELFLNGIEVKVYSTGVFAAPLDLQEGVNELQIWHSIGTDTLRKRMVVKDLCRQCLQPDLPLSQYGYCPGVNYGCNPAICCKLK